MLRGYLEQMRILLQDPTSNLVAAALGVSVVVVVLVIVVLILLFFALSPGSPRKRVTVVGPQRKPKKVKPPTPEQLARVEERRRRARRVWWTTIAGGLLVAWAALFAGTSVNLYCANTCHPMVGPADAWKKSAHKTVDCVRCHEGRPATSFVTGTVSRVHSLYYSLSERPAARIAMPSERCLSCHEGILTKTVVTKQAIAMSHAEPIAAGAVCADCHGAPGHQQEILIVGMSACLRCHDGTRAPTDCALCHPKGIEAGRKPKSQRVGSPVSLPERPKCGGCHPQETCDACHGVRMPHPDDYAKPQKHALVAVFERKDRLCYRCHTPNDCVQCHQPFDAHSEGWKERHKTYKRSDGNGYCLWCHKTQNFCAVCH